jgi:uncharacterized protein YegL
MVLNNMDQLADAVEFADNPEPRCPCVLLLDTSGSMEGRRISALNEGLVTFRDDITKDSLASRRVEVAILTFNNEVNLIQDFLTMDKFQPPVLYASGQTHMASAIERALDLTDARKKTFRANGISYYRPWIFMITDGKPEGESDDEVRQAALRVKASEMSKGVAFFAVGVEGADMERLSQMIVRTPIKLQGLKFGEMFVWLSASMQGVSHSDPDAVMVPLKPVTGWGHVSL